MKGLMPPLRGTGAAQRKLRDHPDHHGPYYLRQSLEDTQVAQVGTLDEARIFSCRRCSGGRLPTLYRGPVLRHPAALV